MDRRLREAIREYVSGPDPVGALAEVARAAGAAAIEAGRELPHGPTKRALVAGCIRMRDAAELAEKIECGATARTKTSGGTAL